MSVEVSNFLSGILGSGLVLALCTYILTRLIAQVDTLADKVDMIHIELTKTTTRLDQLDGSDEQNQKLQNRLTRVESHLKLKSH